MSTSKRDLPPVEVFLPQESEVGEVQAEKFSALEIAELRSELLHSGLDARGTAEVMQSFLAGRGYGVEVEAARAAAFVVEGSGCSLEVMQRELNRIAMVQ